MKPLRITLEEEMLNLYTGNIGQKRWYTRKFRDLSDEEKKSVQAFLVEKGHTPEEGFGTPPAAPVTKSRTIITWDDVEWDQLAALVWAERQKNVTETVVGLVRKVMDSFPQGRRRNITASVEIKPLIERLSKLDEKYLAAATELEKTRKHTSELESQVADLRRQLKEKPTKDDIIHNLTEDEVVVYFGERHLAAATPDQVLKGFSPETLLSYVPFPDLMAQTIKSVFETWVEKQNQLTTAITEMTALMRQQQVKPNKPSMPMPKVGVPRLPRVVIVGLLGEQQLKLESKLKGRAQFHFVDKNRTSGDAIPGGQDIIVLAANFINHALQDQAKKRAVGTSTKLIVHHGGVETMVRKLNELLPQLEAVS